MVRSVSPTISEIRRRPARSRKGSQAPSAVSRSLSRPASSRSDTWYVSGQIGREAKSGRGGIVGCMKESALADGRKRRQVTARWPNGTLINAVVIHEDAESLHVQDGDRYLRLDRRDDGAEWIEGQHLEGSHEVKAMDVARATT